MHLSTMRSGRLTSSACARATRPSASASRAAPSASTWATYPLPERDVLLSHLQSEAGVRNALLTDVVGIAPRTPQPDALSLHRAALPWATAAGAAEQIRHIGLRLVARADPPFDHPFEGKPRSAFDRSDAPTFARRVRAEGPLRHHLPNVQWAAAGLWPFPCRNPCLGLQRSSPTGGTATGPTRTSAGARSASR